jgi:acetylcholinesterase
LDLFIVSRFSSYVLGDCDDEGTLFAFSTLNITTDAQSKQWVNENYLPTATSAEINQLLSLYPSDITKGSPFDTGVLNALTPQV